MRAYQLICVSIAIAACQESTNQRSESQSVAASEAEESSAVGDGLSLALPEGHSGNSAKIDVYALSCEATPVEEALGLSDEADESCVKGELIRGESFPKLGKFLHVPILDDGKYWIELSVSRDAVVKFKGAAVATIKNKRGVIRIDLVPANEEGLVVISRIRKPDEPQMGRVCALREKLAQVSAMECNSKKQYICSLQSAVGELASKADCRGKAMLDLLDQACERLPDLKDMSMMKTLRCVEQQ
jgi:hypothetical protein